MRSLHISRPALAWTLGLAQILTYAQAVVYFASCGIWSSSEIAIPGMMAFAAVGALIASQRVHNRLGWLLLLAPVPVTLNVLIDQYALVSTQNGLSLPFVNVALWIVNWGWTPIVGSFPVILARFPEGRLPRRWRSIDWLAAGGTFLLAAGLGIVGAGSGNNAFAAPFVLSAGGVALLAGSALIAVAMIGAAALLLERYRQGDDKLRSQLKWILLAAIAVALASVYMAVVEVAFRSPFGEAMLPSVAVLAIIPVAIGIAILRHQLFDIDLIVNRTLVYVLLTAVLGGLYIGVVELVQRLFVLYTGQTSNTAIVITAFIVAGAFTPIQKWIDRVVEERFGGRDVATRVDGISSSMQAVVRVIDPHRVARWLVDELVAAFEAEGGALYLNGYDSVQPFHTSGRAGGKVAIDVAVSHDGRDLGRLALGRRRGGMEYSHRDVKALNAAATSLGEALVVAINFGHLEDALTLRTVHADGSPLREVARQ